MRTFSILPAIAAFALAACASTPELDVPPVPAAAAPRFDALAFFAGRTEGHGRLSKVFSGTVPVRVEGSGEMRGGVLHLTQVVREGDKPARTRSWTMREDRPGHYVGSLTDADGPVTGETSGNRLHLAFTMDGMPVEQWLTLSADGRRAYNVLKVRKFGLTVAVLSEDIRKLD